ncbi:T9SS type A sorting domain-containing protein [Hymenobacter terricola]|uniref:T9SS type A sorting domain-containing protein n=1 Tax=Hymenobacter terricola TaxID=2819236 RepID=UPI001B31232E|nr:T9SS type A sorting domain-containing protein [Hymenobacter terricola]
MPWRGGLLLAWVQGAFGIGGDSVRCQFYDAAGTAQWSTPTLIAAYSRPAIIYESEDALNVMPNDSGATVTHALSVNGGGARFTFNRVNANGVRRWPMNLQQVYVAPVGIFPSDYYRTISDGGNGFYMVASAGGFGSPIYAQHFTLQGTAWGAFTTISAGGASGRGSDWHLVRDPAGNLYVVWTSNAGDPLVSKVLPTGTPGWAAPGYVSLTTNLSFQSLPDALWYNNALWVVWNDDIPPASNAFQYMQKVDAAGTLAWPATGVLVNNLPAFTPYPRLAASDNGSVMAFYVTTYSAGTGLRAQKIRPDATLAFPVNGVALHTVDPDRLASVDSAPVTQPNGSVQFFWASAGAAPTGQDVCAGRMQNAGTLLSTERAAEAAGFDVFPNPATSELRVRLPLGATARQLRLYDALGRPVRAYAEAGPAAALSLRGLPAGLYVLRGTLAGQEVSRRVVVQ